jgi:V8-like Glu-specific endopeptidase
MQIDSYQLESTARRFNARETYRERNLRLIKQGRYLEVDSPDRVQKFLSRHGFAANDVTEFLSRTGAGTAEAIAPVAGEQEPFALERVLGTSDLMGVAFLEGGLKVAKTVGRIWVGVAAGRPAGYGTGFMISPRLMMTNHHVLGDRNVAGKSLVEFEYQLGLDGQLLPTSTFAIDVDTFHISDRDMDYAVVAVQPVATNGRRLRDFGWNPMIEEEGKAIIAQWINIIQHPNAEPKQLALRQNQLVDLFDAFLQYTTDTAPGSSGSPLYNDRWEVVGLHHSGVPKKNAAGEILAVDGQVWRREMGEQRIDWIANEGIRISRIIAHARSQPLTPLQKKLVDEMLSSASAPPHETRIVPPQVLAGSLDRTSTGGDPAGATVVVAADGTATWTIPMVVSVKIGTAAATGAAAAPSAMTPTRSSSEPDGAGTITSGSGQTAAPRMIAGRGNRAEVLAAATRELAGRADVLGVRLGYVFKNGWITKDPALVVTVARKQPLAALRESSISPLPESFSGLPVEVTNPTVEDLVRLSRGSAMSELAFGGAETLPEEILYQPPAGATLEKVTAPMRVVAHVSPDAGWPTLGPFLAATAKRLVIGMYDFGAPHVADAVEVAGKRAGFGKMTLVMQAGEDVGSGTKSDDLKDEEVVDKLRHGLGNKFENAWVKIGRVNGWVASSYHIKVVVRDGMAFWLSSGNLQSSNQPDIDPVNEPQPNPKWLSMYNREWHAIVEHAALARTYEQFLLQDFQQNRNHDPNEALAPGLRNLPDVLVPEALFVVVAAERADAIRYFAPYQQSRTFTVRPLLTPDNYRQYAVELIKGAERELLIQNQTFNAPGANQDALREIMEAIRDKQRAGVAVRIIFRVLFPSKARKVLEDLQDFGFDANSIKVQRNCHTKGIVVDRKRVMLGSQNLSNDGVSVNRDASLLFDDEELAKYFGGIFDHDWQNLAKQDIGHESLAVEVASAADPVPRGMVRLTWKDYMEMT